MDQEWGRIKIQTTKISIGKGVFKSFVSQFFCPKSPQMVAEAEVDSENGPSQDYSSEESVLAGVGPVKIIENNRSNF